MKRLVTTALLSLVAGALVAQSNLVPKRAPLDARISATATGFQVEPSVPDYAEAILRVAGPKGEVFRESFEAGRDIVFDPAETLADGHYKWELLIWEELARKVDPGAAPEDSTRAEPRWMDSGTVTSRQGFVTVVAAPQTEGELPNGETGPDRIAEGGLFIEESAATNHNAGTISASGNACFGDALCTAIYGPGEDLEVLDVGGNSRIVMKNATDGSETVDWELGTTTTNFFIEDQFSSGTPEILTLEASAPDNALYVTSAGRVGFGSSAPAEELHIAGTADPAIRLDNGSDFWELRSNSSFMWFQDESFFPFVVASGAPNNSFWMHDNGFIGLGTSTPSQAIELEDTTGTRGTFLIDQQGADASVEVMFNLVCNCAPGFRMQNSVNGQSWFFRHTSAGDFSFDDPNSAGLEMRLTPTGNLFINGSLSQGSSRSLKENLKPFAGDGILEALDGPRSVRVVVHRPGHAPLRPDGGGLRSGLWLWQGQRKNRSGGHGRRCTSRRQDPARPKHGSCREELGS